MNARQQRPMWCQLLLLVLIITLMPVVAAAQAEPAALKQGMLWRTQPPAMRLKAPAQEQPAPAKGTLSQDVWNLIAYTSFPEDNPEIYVTRVNMGITTRLTHHPAGDFYPRLNREATAVAFVSDRDGNWEIYRVNTDGSDLKRLTVSAAADTQPVWSADNLRLAFASERDGNLNIYTMNADGSNQTRLTAAAAADLMPAWSPNGKQIAWVQAGEHTAAIWVMNADGTNPHPITGALRYLQHPVWSPDGTRIAFDYDADNDGWNDLAMVNADGSGLRVVKISPFDMVDYLMGGWSPDAQTLLFTELQYTPYKGELLLTGVSVNEIPAAGGQSNRVSGLNGQAGFPDMRRMDETPPQTSVAMLPQYSRPKQMPVSWGGTDGGASQIAFYDLQYRVGANGTWVDWIIKTEGTEHIFDGVPGTTVYFRSRARDRAGNVEAWRPTADTSTTFYTWALSGQVTDSRGVALPDAAISVAPAAANNVLTQPSGRYTARLTAEGNHTLGASQAGYGPLPNSTLRVTADRNFDLVLPPLDTVVQNGGFEAQADQAAGWAASGSLPAAITTAAPHTGNNAAALGQSCAAPCMGSAEPIRTTSSYSRLAIDSAGTVHMVWLAHKPNTWVPEVNYASRSRDGTWTVPLKLADGFAPEVAVDGLGRVHMIWVSSGQVYYRERSAAGVWGDPLSLSPAGYAKIVADKHGGVHLIYSCNPRSCPGGGQAYYQERLPSGEWQTAVKLDQGDETGAVSFALALGPDGTLHLAWVEANLYLHTLIYQSRSAIGAWQPREEVALGSITNLKLVAGPHGEAHLFHSWSVTNYLHRSAEGMWSEPQTLPAVYSDAAIAADEYGTVHLLTPGALNGESVANYYRKEPNMDWSGPIMHAKTTLIAPAIAGGPDGRLHFTWSDSTTTDSRIQYQTTATVATAGSAALRQSVTIPATMHRPTLSFMYNLIGATPENGSGLEVQLTSGAETATIFSTQARTFWKQGWVDLQPWAGQTVELTFVLNQASDAPNAQVLVDDIALGSWLTPVIEAVSPARADAGTAITITGENFIATPTVYVNGIALSNVSRFDEQTLQATLPPTLRPGVYTVTVVNPGSQKTALAEGLRIGWQVYAPRVLR